MAIRVCNADQRSEEWHLARLGKVTSSRADDVMAKLKGPGEAAARRDYRFDLVIERLTSEPVDSQLSGREIQRGIDMEPYARAKYEAETGHIVRMVGFVDREEMAIGTSPDGVIGEFDGVLEIKCPKSATHISYLKAGVMPKQYLPQVLHHIWVTGANWCDFVSFDDRLPPGLDYFCVRVLRDEAQLAAHAASVCEFLAEVQTEYESLVKLRKTE